MKKKTKKVVALSVPTHNGKPLSLVPTQLQSKQILQVLQKTPSAHIYRRPAKGGGQWEYVTGTYVKKVLNFTFGFCWDFEIKEHGKEGNLMWVLGRLVIKDAKTLQAMIVKEQFGRAEIKFKKGTNDPVDFGNDMKAAATDALKKCASELGIASDVYGKNEFRDIQQEDKNFNPVVIAKVVEQKEKEPECVECATLITKAEAQFSQTKYNKILCRDCQNNQTK